jgi:hypothetical protein
MNYTKQQIFEAMMFAFNTFSDRLSMSEVEDRINIYIDAIESEWDDSHELNNVMNNIVNEVFPEFNSSKSVLDKLSDLPREHWEQIPFDSAVYDTVLFKTQDLIPIDSGNSLHCHHADYDLNNTIYRLTWTIGAGVTEKPIIEFKTK